MFQRLWRQQLRQYDSQMIEHFKIQKLVSKCWVNFLNLFREFFGRQTLYINAQMFKCANAAEGSPPLSKNQKLVSKSKQIKVEIISLRKLDLVEIVCNLLEQYDTIVTKYDGNLSMIKVHAMQLRIQRVLTNVKNIDSKRLLCISCLKSGMSALFFSLTPNLV